MSTLMEAHTQLARTLPLRLQKFFCLNPPRLINGTLLAPGAVTTPSTTATTPLAPTRPNFLNPFQPNKNLKTGHWHPPLYSLRRQAELVKLARQHGVEDLLPPTIKDPQAIAQRRAEFGLRVKGTGAGQKVKGHEWERTLKGKLERRRKAMLEMPAMVQSWKQRGHGRGWTKWPSGKAGKD